MHQHLERTVAKSPSAAELARELITTLATELLVSAKSIKNFVRDGAVVNTAAVRYLKDLLYPTALDVKYPSHCLDNVGRHFNFQGTSHILLDPILYIFLEHGGSTAANSYYDQSPPLQKGR